MRKRCASAACLSVLLSLLIPSGASAAVRLPSFYSDNMVLQQRSSVEMRGWASPGETVRVTAGWTMGRVSGVASDDGNWRIVLKTAKAGGPDVCREVHRRPGKHTKERVEQTTPEPCCAEPRAAFRAHAPE